MWRGGKAKSRPVPVLPETERLKMGALVPSNIFSIVKVNKLQEPHIVYV